MAKEKNRGKIQRQSVSAHRNSDENKVITDSRFSGLHSDPRFQRIPKNKSKVSIDSRFHRMFSDTNFSSTSRVDKRGKKKEKSRNPLLHYYHQQEGDAEAAENGSEEQLFDEKKSQQASISDANELREENGDRGELGREKKKEKKKKKKRKIGEEISEDGFELGIELGEKSNYLRENEIGLNSDDEIGADLELKQKKRKKKKKTGAVFETDEIVEDAYWEDRSSQGEARREMNPSINNSESRLGRVSGPVLPEKSSSSSESELQVEDNSDQSDRESSSTSSSSSDDDDDSEIDSDDEQPDQKEEEVPEIEHATHRLAVVDMDWNHIKAVDLYVLMSSFLPKGGQILSVAIYPSEFGLNRMAEEEVHGPSGIFDSDKEQSDDDDDDNDAEIHNEKLRAYEKSRLRYYYAVVDCDSASTADHLYKNCDGLEYERTSNILDLRFVPDNVEFKYPLHDIATEAPLNYGGLDFHTRALQHSKIHLSWDDDEPQRAKILKQKFNSKQLDEMEFKDFLASDDEETGNDESNEFLPDNKTEKLKKQDKYRALLQAGNGSDADDDDDQDMEVTFSTGLENISKHILEKKKNKEMESVWEAYLRKRKEKRDARKNASKFSSEDDGSDSYQESPEQPDDFFVEEDLDANVGSKPGKKHKKETKHSPEIGKEQEASRAELELLFADDKGAGQGVKGYNLKAKKHKGKKQKEVMAEDKLPDIDYDDPRFSAMFTNHFFALDPTDPQFKRSATYARQLARKQKKGGKIIEEGQMNPSAQVLLELKDMPLKKDKEDLSSLIRSVKRKAGTLQC